MIKITLGRKNINDNCGNIEKGSWQFIARTTTKEVKSAKFERQSHEDCFWKREGNKEQRNTLQNLSGKKKKEKFKIMPEKLDS